MKFLSKLYRFSTTWVGTIIIVLLVIFFIAQAFIIPSRSMVNTLYEGDMLFVKKFSYGIPIPRIPWIEVPVFPDINNNGHIIEGKRPKRGEIVIFIPPHLEKTYFVKRTFATGGDEVIMAEDGLYLRPSEGDSYINEHFKDSATKVIMGKLFVHNPYINTYKGIHYGADNIAYTLLKKISYHNGGVMDMFDENGEIFFYYKVEDDHFFMVGDNRDGSEDSRFWGDVPYRDIIGTPWFIYFSLNLTNSDESKLDSNNTYKIRWERMFKGINGIEKLSAKNAESKTLDSSVDSKMQNFEHFQDFIESSPDK